MVTYPCDEGSTDDGVFGVAQFSQSLVQIASTFSFVVVMRNATPASSLAGAVITWETVPCSGTATTSSACASLVDFPRGLVNLVGELSGKMAGEPVVVCPEVCNHEVPLVMSPVMQATGFRIVLTWSMAPLNVDLHVFWENHIQPFIYFFGSQRANQVDW